MRVFQMQMFSVCYFTLTNIPQNTGGLQLTYTHTHKYLRDISKRNEDHPQINRVCYIPYCVRYKNSMTHEKKISGATFFLYIIIIVHKHYEVKCIVEI